MPWPQGLEQGNHPWESQSPNPRGDRSCPHRSHQILQGRRQQGLLWDAPYRGSLTPQNIQHPPQKVQISMCPLWTQNVTRYLPDEDGWHCGPMPLCIGHPWWHVHLWKAWQGPQCKHHKLVQCGPKRRTRLQQHKMCHKTGVCNILWQSSLQRDTPQIQRKFKTSPRWHHPRQSKSYNHWAPLGPPQKGKLLCLGWQHPHVLPENKAPPAESPPETPEILWSGQTSHPPVWCLTQGARSLHHPGWTAHCFCKQVPHGHWDPLCHYQERTLGHHIWLWEIPHIPVQKDIQHGDRP